MPLYGGLEVCQRVGRFGVVWKRVPEAYGAWKKGVEVTVYLRAGDKEV